MTDTDKTEDQPLTDKELEIAFVMTVGIAPRGADVAVLDTLGRDAGSVAEYLWDHWLGEPDSPTADELKVRIVKFVPLLALAGPAYCVDDADYGSERQIAAFNAFNDYVNARLEPAQRDRLDAFALKASSDEAVDEALRLLGWPPGQ